MARTKPRKWIAAEVAGLDPHTDYERIWQLANVYAVSDFLMDYIYAITFPRFLVTFRGSHAVLRDGALNLVRGGGGAPGKAGRESWHRKIVHTVIV